MARVAAALLLAGLLSGCGASPAEQRQSDGASCTGYGFAPGTDAYANCLMQADQRRDAEAQSDRRAAARLRAQQRQQDDRDSAAFRARLLEPPDPPRAPPDPFVVPNGLQIPGPKL